MSAKYCTLPVVIDDHSEIGGVHRYRLSQSDLAAAPHVTLHLAGRPALVVGEQHLGQMDWVLHAHAAVAECAHGAAEQMPLRRIVHVDVVPVGEAKFDDAQDISRPGRLDEFKTVDIHLRPIDCIGVHRLATARHL